MKFLNTENPEAWLHDDRLNTCEDEKTRGELNDPDLQGKQIAIILTIKGERAGEWKFFYPDSYPRILRNYLYEKARTIEEEGKV